jgi:hypothetical protein
MKHHLHNNQSPAILVAVSLALAICTQAQAQNLLINGSFETGAFTNQGSGFMLLAPGATNISGWTVINDQLAWAFTTNSDSVTPADGSFFLDLQGPGLFGAPYGGVSQTITTVTGQVYRFSFQLGTQEAIANDRGPVSVSASADGTTLPFTFAPAGSGVQWGEFRFDFTATNTSTVIGIVGTATTGGAYIGLDKASVVAVQRPSLTLLTPGGAGTAIVRLTGGNGFRYAVDASTDLAGWLPVATNTVSGGFADYTDSGAVGASFRFYRGRWVP